MKIKHKFWKLLIGVLLYSLITHWKDTKQGFLDGINDVWQENTIQNPGK